MTRTRTRLLGAALALAGLAVLMPGGAPARDDGSSHVLLRVGDTLQVEGAGIGCQVTERGGRATIECRRAGRLAGTYTAIFDDRRARVARFRNANTAKVVFTAKHGGKARACTAAAKAARRGGCR